MKKVRNLFSRKEILCLMMCLSRMIVYELNNVMKIMAPIFCRILICVLHEERRRRSYDQAEAENQL